MKDSIEEDLKQILTDIDPIIYHCSDLRNVKFEDRDTDILRDGIIPPCMYDEFETDIDGSGYGGSFASEDTELIDHISVWVQNEETPITTEETMNTFRGEKDGNIAFVLNPDIDWKFVNNYTEKDCYHTSEGLAKGPVEINNRNIEVVVIAKKKIMENYSGENANPPQSFWKEHISSITQEIESRGIPVYLTDTLPEY